LTERLKDKSGFTRHYRKIDYEEFTNALKNGEFMFYTGDAKRQAVWKATRKLSGMVGKKVVAVYGEKELDGVQEKGYLFMVEETKS